MGELIQPNSHSSVPDQIESATRQLLATPLSRRQFGVGTITLLELLNAACTPAHTPPRSVPETTKTPEVKKYAREVVPAVTKAELRQILQGFEASPYKDFAIKYALPFLNDPVPAQINLAGLPIDIFDFRVITDATDSSNIYLGEFSLRTPQKGPKVTLEKQNITAIYPYVFSDGRMASRTWAYVGDEISYGFEPEIIYHYPGNLLVNSNTDLEKMDKFREAIMLKEIYSLAACVSFAELMAKQMSAAKLPLFMKTHGKPVDAVSVALLWELSRVGRVAALLDIGAYALAIKATRNNRTALNAMRADPRHDKFITAVDSYDFGTTPDVMFTSVTKFLDSHSELFQGKPWYNGDLNKPF